MNTNVYGGTSGTPAEQAYYKEFTALYPGIADWHIELQNEAIRTRCVRTPSGREYAFPYAERTPWGGSTFATQIKNFPVQGFATADIVPIANILLRHLLLVRNLRSLHVNTVHDNCIVDVYPGERELAAKTLTQAMMHAQVFAEKYYGFEFGIPLDIELKIGPNNLDMEHLSHEIYLSEPLEISPEMLIYSVS